MTRDEIAAELQRRGVDPENPSTYQKPSASSLTPEQISTELRKRGVDPDNPSSQPSNDKGDGSIMSFIRSVGNQMPLGKQFSALASPGSYSANMEAQNQNAAQNQAQHPIASGLGNIVGAVAPALIPGVGEAMVANPGITGAIMGGTNAISDTDIKQHPLQAAGEAALGAGTGGILSKGISAIMPQQSTLEAKANTLANKSVNMPKGALINMTPEEQQAQGAALRSAGIVTPDKAQALSKAENLLQDYGQKIGSVAKTTEGQGLVADPDQHYSVISNLLNKAQEFAGSANKVSKAIGRDYKAGATDIANLPDNPSWNAIQDLKEKYGSFAFKPTATQGAKDTYFALSDMLKGIADKAQNSSLGDQYKTALKGYSQMSPVVDGLKDSVDLELRGVSGGGIGFHPMRMLAAMPGPVRAAGGAIAALTGHPLLAVAAGLPEAMNPAIQSNVIGSVAKTLPTIQAGIQQLVAKAATTPQAQAKVADLIQQLQQKYADRR